MVKFEAKHEDENSRYLTLKERRPYLTIDVRIGNRWKTIFINEEEANSVRLGTLEKFTDAYKNTGVVHGDSVVGFPEARKVYSQNQLHQITKEFLETIEFEESAQS